MRLLVFAMRAGLSTALGVFLAAPAAATTRPFLRGVDPSFLPAVEAAGVTFEDAAGEDELFELLGRNGVNAVRVRLWNSPASPHSDLASTLILAQRAREAGCSFVLDLHYSDTWADAGHQSKPRAWQELSFGALTDSVRAYTAGVLRALQEAGVVPHVVQLGNEITSGFLWNDGRVGGEFDTVDQWNRLSTLLEAALAGIDEALKPSARPQIILHLDGGGDPRSLRWFLDRIARRDISFDGVGLSFYPWWHGGLSDLQAAIDVVAREYGMDVYVLETAYPWTLQWFDDTHNIVGVSRQLLEGYPATPDGQARYLTDLIEVVRQAHAGRGRGVFWWSPEWTGGSGFGSSWENMTLFDETGRALPALRVLGGLAASR